MTMSMEDRDAAMERTSARLLKSSQTTSYDPLVDIDWDAPIDPSVPFMQPQHTTLYGTELWDGMTEQQRLDLGRNETASIASAGVWFEEILMQLLLRSVYDLDPRSAQARWALTEIADECRHSTMFGMYLDKIGVAPYRHSKALNELGRVFKAVTWGPSSYAAILVAEEILDEAQREWMSDQELQPLVRQVSKIHVVEESRHIRFAREQIANMMEAGLSQADLVAQQTMCAVVGFAIVESMIAPGVYANVGLDAKEAIKAARANPNMHRTRQQWGSKVVEFLEQNNLMGGPASGLWKACHLVGDDVIERGVLGRGVDLGTVAALEAASSVLINVPGLSRLAKGTVAGVDKAKKQAKKEAKHGKHAKHGGHHKATEAVTSVAKDAGTDLKKRSKTLTNRMATQLQPLVESTGVQAIMDSQPVQATIESQPVQAIKRALPSRLQWGLRGGDDAPERRRTKPPTSMSVHRLKVAEIERLTADSVAVTFDVPDDVRETFRYLPGQHIAIDAVIDGKRVRRNYSICAPAGSQRLRVGVKKVPDGVFSTYIVDTLAVGDEVDIVPPAGRFTTPLDAINTNNYVGIAGGSGITPILSLLTSILDEERASTFTLVYANRDVDSIMFRDELDELERSSSGRLRVIHILEEAPPEYLEGRVDGFRLASLMSRGDIPDEISDWFLCGPAPMTEAVSAALRSSGIDIGKIHLELFNSIGSTDALAVTPAADLPPVADDAPTVARLTFTFEGAEESVDVREGELLLDAALRTGQDIPWSCREAVCGMCRAQVCEGATTRMLENHFLSDVEVESGIVLTCQTKPASDALRLDYNV